MIEAELDDFGVVWQAGRVSIRPGLVAEMEAEVNLIARTRLAADCLRLQAEIERLLTLPAYDPAAFETDDRPFRVPPGSLQHARLVLEGLGAEIDLELDDDDDLAAFEAEVAEADVGLTSADV